MNEDKLYEAARSEASDLIDGAHQTDSKDLVEAFVRGARWHESLPLSDRLGESEKEKIRKFYHTIWGKGLNKLQHELSDIFGKTLFNPTEQWK